MSDRPVALTGDALAEQLARDPRWLHEHCGWRADSYAPDGCPDPGAHRQRPLHGPGSSPEEAAKSASAIPFPVLSTHDKVLLIQFTTFEDRQLFRQWLTEAATWEAFSAYAARQT